MGRSMANSQSWENRATSSYYGGLMNIKIPATRQRMLRRDHLKLCVYDGYAPQLFDLAKDPWEIQDISNERPKELSALMQEISATWNPGEIAKIQNCKAKRTKFLLEWVQTTKPEERFRWKDPNPERNRYV
jgi:arylsulfatase A-like enzyme